MSLESIRARLQSRAWEAVWLGPGRVPEDAEADIEALVDVADAARACRSSESECDGWDELQAALEALG